MADEQRLTNSALDYSSHLSPLDQRLVNQFDRGIFFISNGRISFTFVNYAHPWNPKKTFDSISSGGGSQAQKFEEEIKTFSNGRIEA